MANDQDAKVDPDAVNEKTTLALLRQEASMYDRLESLAKRQRSCVTSDDATQLLAVLGDRQRLADELMQLGRRLSPLRNSWSSHRNTLPEDQREEADALIGRTAECLKRIMSGDEEDSRILSARKKLIAEGLRATHAPGQALAAYGGSGQRGEGYGRLDQAS